MTPGTDSLGGGAVDRDPAPLVLVTGAPGSGIGRVARALEWLGLSGPADGGDSLRAVGQAVLESQGAGRGAPADEERAATGHGDRMGRALAESFPEGRPAVWGDHGIALLGGLWRAAARRPLVAVLVWRDPLAAAEEMAGRQGVPLVHGLALWELYNHGALTGLAGMPVFVTRLDRAVAEPGDWCREAAAFLHQGGAGGDWDTGTAAGALAEGLASPGGQAPGLVLGSQEALAGILESLGGRHRSLPVGRLPDPSPWSGAVLANPGGNELALWRALHWATGELALALGAEDPGVGDDGSQTEPVSPPGLDATADTAAYRAWLRERGEDDGGQPVPEPGPVITVAVPVYRPQLPLLERCVGSVLGQQYPHLELCLCDDGTGDSEVDRWLASLARRDSRVRVTASPENAGISAATNAAIALGRGEWVALLDQDDELDAGALAAVVRVIDERPDADVLYTDEDKIDGAGERFHPHFKPEWSPDLLLSCPYLGHLLVVRRRLLNHIGGLRSEYDGSQDYDLMLRATERARAVVRVTGVRYHWRAVPGSAALDMESKPWAHDASRRALTDALARRGEQARVEPTATLGCYHVRREVQGQPLVSLLVPFRDGGARLRTRLESLRTLAGYGCVEIVAVDNGSVEPETQVLLPQLAGELGVRIVGTGDGPGRPGSWSAAANAAAGRAHGDILVFLDDRVEARRPGWLLPLVEQAQRERVGAVGGCLVDAWGRPENLGIVLGLRGGAGDRMAGLVQHAPAYMAGVTRNVSAVAGACLATRRAVLEELEGLDEGFVGAYYDVDYCLRAGAEGYRVVVTPLAQLMHHAALGRVAGVPAGDLARLVGRWGDVLSGGDPYYNPNLSLDHREIRLRPRMEEDPWPEPRRQLDPMAAR